MPEKNQNFVDPSDLKQTSLPFLLKLVLWIMALWTILGWLRFSQTIIQHSLIIELTSTGVFYYLLFAGLMWGGLGLVVLWGWVNRSGWTPAILWFAGFFYPLFYWIERALLWKDVESQRNWPFMLVLTLAWLVLVALSLRSEKTRRYFSAKHDEDRNGYDI